MFNALRTRVAGGFKRTSLTRHVSIVALAVAAYGVSACSAERVAGPSMERAHSTLIASTTTTLSSTLTKVTGLRWSKSATASATSKVIGAAGGTLTAAGGLTLTVPKGAVSKNTTFTVTRLAGNVVAYDFAPHGVSFALPLQITQSTAGTNFSTYALSAFVRGGYFKENSLLDQLAGTALISEFRPATVAQDRSTVKFTVNHFSGYMVSMD